MFLIPVKVPSLIFCFCHHIHLFIKYFKGVNNLRPPTQKITFVWNEKIVFNYFSDKGGNDELSDKSLTQKLFTFTAGRPKNKHYIFFTVDRTAVTDIGVTFSPNHVLKHSKPGKKLHSFHYRAYHNKRLCVVECLKEYLKLHNTKVQTYTNALFITNGKPFRVAAVDSMRRWVKELFMETSILKEYTPHTCRSAATSKASQLNVDIAEILKQGCWKNAKIFFSFYKKDIVYDAPEDVDFMIILT